MSDPALRWVDRGNHLTVAALDPFVVDKEAGWLGVFGAIGGSEFS